LTDLALKEIEVARLDVAMNDVVGMGIGQSLGRLFEQNHRVDKPQWLTFEPTGKVLALQPFHHEIALPADHAMGQVAHNGRMLE